MKVAEISKEVGHRWKNMPQVRLPLHTHTQELSY